MMWSKTEYDRAVAEFAAWCDAEAAREALARLDAAHETADAAQDALAWLDARHAA